MSEHSYTGARESAIVLRKLIYMLGSHPLPEQFPAALVVGPLAVSVDCKEFLLACTGERTDTPIPQLCSSEYLMPIADEARKYVVGKVALGRMRVGGISIDASVDAKNHREVQVSLNEGNAQAVLASHEEDGWLFTDTAITDEVIGVPAEGLQYRVSEEYDASRLAVLGGAGEIRMGLKPGKTIRLSGLVSKEPTCRNGNLAVANFAGSIYLPRDANVQYSIRTTTGDVLGDIMHLGTIKSEIGNIAINCNKGLLIGFRGESDVYGMKRMYSPKKTRHGFHWYRTVQTPGGTVLLRSETGLIIVGDIDHPIPQANAEPTCGHKIVRRRYFGM